MPRITIAACILAAAVGLSSCSTSGLVTPVKLSESQQSVRQRELLIGRWMGEAPLRGGGTNTWVMQRFEDGTFKIDFKSVDPSGVSSAHTETGIWGVSGGIYFTATRGFIDDGTPEQADTSDPALYDTYKIKSLSRDSFEYKSISTGDHFWTHRVPESARSL